MRFLKFFIEKNTLKKNLRFQLTSIKTQKQKAIYKIYNFSITRLGRKRKSNMSLPVETIVIHVQQSFEIAGGLNPVQIEIEDYKIINILKKYSNVIYKMTPIGLLFPASIRNDIKQIFVTGR